MKIISGTIRFIIKEIVCKQANITVVFISSWMVYGQWVYRGFWMSEFNKCISKHRFLLNNITKYECICSKGALQDVQIFWDSTVLRKVGTHQPYINGVTFQKTSICIECIFLHIMCREGVELNIRWKIILIRKLMMMIIECKK